MKRTTKAGFTLVELIVVIAILGILAGIAIPVYSNYIKKAHKAADLELLGAANTALAAAATENGVGRLSNAQLVVSGKVITGVNCPEDGTMEDGVAAHPINDSFVKYFGSNSDTELQYFESADEFKYLPALGVFVSKEDYEKNGATVTLPNGSTMKITKDDGAGTTTVTVTDSEGNEITFTANTSDIENVNNSTFGTNMTMGELMGDVSSVVSAAAQVVNNPSMIASMIGEENLARYGITPDAEGNYDADQLFNAVVLAVAEGTSSMGTAEQIIAAVESGEFLSLSGGLNDPQLLPKAALAYGMLTGFANSDVGQTATITIGEGDEAQTMTVKEYFEQQNAALSGASGGGAAIGIVFNMLNTMTGSEGWNTYYTTQGPTDLTGYLSAMNAIADNTGAIADSGALTSGFDDPNLVAILNGMFGGGN